MSGIAWRGADGSGTGGWDCGCAAGCWAAAGPGQQNRAAAGSAAAKSRPATTWNIAEPKALSRPAGSVNRLPAIPDAFAGASWPVVGYAPVVYLRPSGGWDELPFHD